METDEILAKAVKHGHAIGQTALAEFILRTYKDELSPNLSKFLARVSQQGSDDIGANLNLPSEDVAREIDKIITKRLTF